jgi:hypothetical protein
MEGSGSNVIITFINSRTYIDPPVIVGTSFTFGPEQDSQSAGTQLELKNASFTLLGNRLNGSVEYYTTTGSLRTGTFSMDRIN